MTHFSNFATDLLIIFDGVVVQVLLVGGELLVFGIGDRLGANPHQPPHIGKNQRLRNVSAVVC